MQIINIIIVDDHPSVRFGLQSVLNKFDDINVMHVAQNGQIALELCRKEQPDIALVDMHMPGMTGLETVVALHSEFPEIKLLVLTHDDNDNLVVDVMNAGAIGYLIKNAEINDIAHAIRAATNNQRTLSPEALEALISAKTAPTTFVNNDLTERELDILRLMADGMRNPQIAKELTITLSTVKFHVSSILAKLGAQTRTEAVVRAMNDGLLSD